MPAIRTNTSHTDNALTHASTGSIDGRDLVMLDEVDRGHAAFVGGKAAQLGELLRIEGVVVPAGFCITTRAFERVLATYPEIAMMRDQLWSLSRNDAEQREAASARLRLAIEATPMPDDLVQAITTALEKLGLQDAYAVRSSATDEDLAMASFAGQHDSFLNLRGASTILRHVAMCWSSLFTAHAVAYRLRQRADHREARMAVVVQRMIFPRVSGVLFTADPITGHRRNTIVEASFGLGEPFVSGRVNADTWTVRDEAIVTCAIVCKSSALHAADSGGVEEVAVDQDRQTDAALTDAQVFQIVRLGRRIEAHLSAPQDIEWCIDEDGFHIVQSRPITMPFPLPADQDSAPHVYVSVGHGQMMTDAMSRMGIHVWQCINGNMVAAGNRLFVDVAGRLSTESGQADLLDVLGKGDPLIGDALRTLIERQFVPLRADGSSGGVMPPHRQTDGEIDTDPAIVASLIAESEQSLGELEHAIRGRTGTVLIRFIQDDIGEMKRLLTRPRSHQAIMAGMEAAWWLNAHLHDWLGETNAADVLSRSAPGNVTSEMGLELLDVADAFHAHPDTVTCLEKAGDKTFLDALDAIEGGRAARDALQTWLDRHGSRCAGEIDIAMPRWSEDPSPLVPLLLGHIRTAEPGAAYRRFVQGDQEALNMRLDVLHRLRALPDGEEKATQTERMIDRMRTFAGYREYPKFDMVRRLFVYRQALLREADRLVDDGVLRERDDCFQLDLPELHEAVRNRRVDPALIDQRKRSFSVNRSLSPPRVMTSDGERVEGFYRRGDLPEGALPGVAVSTGVVEGRARIVLELRDANLEPGDILVTRGTDPSWTPCFVSIAGLVTEVGGLMTHGAVIAREYGLPAVVCVENATTMIREGQRIRVHGTRGYVEVLE